MRWNRVIVVGSGVAGAAIAERLLGADKAGEVLMLEAGPDIVMGDRRRWLDFVATDRRPYQDGEDIDSEYVSGPVIMNLKESRLFGRGGSTIHWGGWCLRFKPEDFALKTAARTGLDWPFGYDELRRYYDQAEHFLGVAGNSDDHDPPRGSDRYPFEAVPFTQADGIVIDALDGLDYSHANLPIARSGDSCLTTGTCKYCPVGGRYTTDRTIDDLTNGDYPGRFELRLNSAVRRVLMRNRSEAVGVEYLDLATREFEFVEADAVILCLGAIETPKLLLASADRAYAPNGLGNGSGHVGQHLVTHPLVSASGILGSNSRRVQQEIGFPTLCSREFDTPAEQPQGKFFFIRSHGGPKIRLERNMRSGEKLEEIEEAVVGKMVFKLRGFVEQFAADGNSVQPTNGETRFGLPRTKINYYKHQVTQDSIKRNRERLEKVLTALGCTDVKSKVFPPRADHLVATCRMSNSDVDGVVDDGLRVHGSDNLYICSNAVFPNVAAVNPTLTLTALALRFVDRL